MNTGRSRRALILGPKSTARGIAQSLEKMGFETELSPELPTSTVEGSERALEKAFRDFAARCPVVPGLAHCVHPGTSRWAERTELPAIAQRCGLSVIAPPTKALSLFGNKLNLLEGAEKIGIPTLVADFTPIHGIREIERVVSERGFPVILKSARGAGSHGIHVVTDAKDLEKRVPVWLEQVRLNLGEVFLFAERGLEGARSVLIPFARFIDGRCETFPSVDVSLQSRYRKIVEFCPAPGLGRDVERRIREWSMKLAETTGFVGVGSFEFMVDADRAFLVDGSARLNLEFRLWERIAGTSAVEWQFATLEGGANAKAPVRASQAPWKNGVSLRLYAENPFLQLPQPGKVREMSEQRNWAFPAASADLAMEVDAPGCVEAKGLGLVGHLVVGASELKLALTVARGVLDEIWIAGDLQTNERFLAELIAHPWIQEGMFHSAFVDDEFIPSRWPPSGVLQAMVLATMNLEERSGEARWAVADKWVKASGRLNWVSGPEIWSENGLRGLSGALRFEDGRVHRVCAAPIDEGKWQVRIGNWVSPVRRELMSPLRPRIAALVAGRIHSILFRKGSVVPAHETLLVIESLGMLVPHALPVAVHILDWKVGAEDEVLASQELAEFLTLPGEK